jgi:hypothetical protein
MSRVVLLAVMFRSCACSALSGDVPECAMLITTMNEPFYFAKAHVSVYRSYNDENEYSGVPRKLKVASILGLL